MFPLLALVPIEVLCKGVVLIWQDELKWELVLVKVVN